MTSTDVILVKSCGRNLGLIRPPTLVELLSSSSSSSSTDPAKQNLLFFYFNEKRRRDINEKEEFITHGSTLKLITFWKHFNHIVDNKIGEESKCRFCALSILVS